MTTDSERAPARPAPLSILPVIIGGVLGIVLGIFVGDDARFLRPIGRLYVMLLEVAVYPYLICSLVHGLGSMSPSHAWKLFLSGWRFYVALWIITFGLLIVLAQGIPEALSTSWVADRAAACSTFLFLATCLRRWRETMCQLLCFSVCSTASPSSMSKKRRHFSRCWRESAWQASSSGTLSCSSRLWQSLLCLATWRARCDPEIWKRSRFSSFSFFRDFAVDLLDYSGVHFGVHASSLQRSSARSQFGFGDCCCHHLIGLGAALHLVRDAAARKTLWN